MASIEILSKHTIHKTIEVDGKVDYEYDMTYAEYCEELADLLYGKVACKYDTRIRWTRDYERGVYMPTVYPCIGVAWRYKVVK